MREIVDLLDRIADLLIALVRQNKGTLSKRKSGVPEFLPLTDEEIAALKTVVREAAVC